MDFVKLLQSLEDAIFEIVTWIMLLPKTLLFVTFRPGHAIEYVNQEFKQEPDKRFDEYLSPVVLWLIAGVIPVIFAFLDMKGMGLTAATEQSNLIRSIGFAIITPLVYMALLERANKRPIRKSNLKRQFYIQSYLLSPIQFLLFVFVSLLRHSRSFVPTLFFSVLAVALLLIFYESFAFRSELKCTRLKAMWLATIPHVVFALVIVTISVFGPLLALLFPSS